jgi:hypothetical protein
MVLKAYTENTVKATNMLGAEYVAPMYVWKQMEFCVRCGKKVSHEA